MITMDLSFHLYNHHATALYSRLHSQPTLQFELLHRLPSHFT
jgi:hypothetical protein